MFSIRRLAFACVFLCLASRAQAQGLLWTGLCGAVDPYGDGGLAADKAGNLYALVTAKGFDGTRLNDNANAWGVVKFGPRGEKLWTRMWGESEYDFARGAATGPDGSVYVVGKMVGAAIAKLDGNGVVQWNVHGKRAELAEKDHSEFRSVAVDATGSAYAAGWTSGGVHLAKYSSAGQLVWSRIFKKANSDANGLALDAQGNIYLVGRCDEDWDGQSNHGSGDFYLMKLNNAGEKLWVREYGGPHMDWGVYVAVDPEGSVLAVGYSERQPSGSGYEINLFKHDPSGNLIHAKQGGTTHFGNNYHGFVHDGEGGFYGTVVTAAEPVAKRAKRGPKTSQALVKYGKDGERIWSAPFGDANLGMGDGAVVDAQGFIYTLGSRTEPKTKVGDEVVLKFAPYAPSFDCGKAVSLQEKLICGSRLLSGLDRTLAQLYAAALKSGPNAAKLKADQVQWLRTERSRCATAEDLEKSMNARIELLRLRTSRAGAGD